MSQSRKLMQIKDDIAEATADKTRAEGALEQSMKRLRSEFECKSLKQAQRSLSALEDQAEQADRELNEAIRDLEKRYGDI